MNKFFSFFKKIKNKRYIIIYVLAVFAVLSASAFVYASFLYSKRTKAAVSCVGSGPQTCTFSNGAFTITEGQYDGAIIVVDASVITLSGQHRFNNLTLRNGSLLTHSALIKTTDFDPVSNELTASGKQKKVILAVDNTISFENNSRISADFLGYPGGEESRPYADCHRDCGSGYGPGGGGNNDSHDEWTRGAGGSYGGKGGEGTHYSGGYAGWAKPPYGKLLANVDSAQHGSGGGSALRHTHNSRSPGASGGGAIYIVTGDLLVDGSPGNAITANGNTVPQQLCSSWAMCGGSGSGGSVYIRLTKFTGQTRFNAAAAGGRSDKVAEMVGGDGPAIVRGFANDTGRDLTIKANGGAGGLDNANQYSYSGGGGGRILVEIKQDFTMKKELIPILRVNSATFDPYALRVNDLIEVRLTVERMDDDTIIKDDVLKQFGGSKCVPLPDTVAASGGRIVGDSVEWSNIPNRSSFIFKYQCRVI